MFLRHLMQQETADLAVFAELINSHRPLRQPEGSLSFLQQRACHLSEDFNFNLRRPFVYLSRPMYPCIPRVPWRRPLEIACQKDGKWLFDPVSVRWPFYEPGLRVCPQVRAGAVALLDYLLIYHCSLLVAEVTLPSFGVAAEIDWALRQGRPVLCVASSTSDFIRAHHPVITRQELEESLRKSSLQELIAKHVSLSMEKNYEQGPSLQRLQ